MIRSASGFNLAIEMLFISGQQPNAPHSRHPRFNLAIEMLFISGRARYNALSFASSVSISQSRCFSFQVYGGHSPSAYLWNVSISQSRGFSFQVNWMTVASHWTRMRFNLAIEMLFISGRKEQTVVRGPTDVSISQSRCFSFQVQIFGQRRRG